MMKFKNLPIFRNHFFSVQNKMMQFESKPWIYPLVYAVIYFAHCFFSWDQMLKINSQIELKMMANNEPLSIFQLYPFQIISIYLLFLLYFVFTYVFVILFRYIRVLKRHSSFLQFFGKNIRIFFLTVCLLYLGNLILGMLKEFEMYSFFVFCFWISAFSFFVIKNGVLYSEVFSSKERSSLIQVKRIGYLVPILWFVLFAYLAI